MILVPLLNPKSQTHLPRNRANFGFAALGRELLIADGQGLCTILPNARGPGEQAEIAHRRSQTKNQGGADR